MLEKGVYMLAQFAVVLLGPIVCFLRIVTDLLILIHSFDKISTRSVRLSDLACVFAISGNDLVQLDDTGVSKLEEVVKLTIGTFSIGDILIGVKNLFDGEYLMRLFVFDLIHLTVRSLSEKAEYLIGFIDMIVDFRLIF
jgi:hypothetical protein